MNHLCRYARTLALILSATMLAFVLLEVVVRHLVGFPTRQRGRLIVVDNGSGAFNLLLWERPYSRIWSVEGGNIVVQYNNLGLPGCDVQSKPDSGYVFVLGSSYVEAHQLLGDSIATSVLQRTLSRNSPRFQVLNLGLSGADAYTSWLHARYFAGMFPASGVILVIDEFHGDWLKNHRHPLSFSLAPSFGTDAVLDLPVRLMRWSREKSAVVNLVAEAVRSAKRAENGDASRETGTSQSEAVPGELRLCLERYKQDFGTRFVVVSVLTEQKGGKELAECCQTLGIPFVDGSMVDTPENRFQQYGHFNARGNMALGKVLHDAFLMLPGHPAPGGPARMNVAAGFASAAK